MGGVAASSLAYLSMNTVDRRMLWLYSCSGSDTTDLYTFEYSQGGDDWTPLEDGTMVWLPDPEEQQPCQVLDRGRNVYGGLSVSSDRNSELYFRWSRGESGLATLETCNATVYDWPQDVTVSYQLDQGLYYWKEGIEPPVSDQVKKERGEIMAITCNGRTST